MGNINIKLLESKRYIATYNDTALSSSEPDYHIIAGENNATTFTIIKPNGYGDYTFWVEMVNAAGKGLDAERLKANSEKEWIKSETQFSLPEGMAVEGYGYISIYATPNNVSATEKVVWMPIKVKVWNSLPNWSDSISEGEYVTKDDFNAFRATVESNLIRQGGSVAYEDLPFPLVSTFLTQYNITNAFTTDTRFVEGSGHSYPAGTNVLVVNVGSDIYRYDVLSGVLDDYAKIDGNYPLLSAGYASNSKEAEHAHEADHSLRADESNQSTDSSYAAKLGESTTGAISVGDKESPVYFATGVPAKCDDVFVKNYGDQSVVGNFEVTKNSVDEEGTGNLTVYGDLVVRGSTFTTSQETLTVDSNMLVTNGQGVQLMDYSGLGIMTGNSGTEDAPIRNAFGLVYDPLNDTVKLGEGKLSTNNEFAFNAGEGKPLAIRADAASLSDGHVIEWQAEGNLLIDSGLPANTLAQKSGTYPELGAGYDDANNKIIETYAQKSGTYPELGAGLDKNREDIVNTYARKEELPKTPDDLNKIATYGYVMSDNKIIDATGLDENKWYPVTVNLPGAENIRIEVYAILGYSGVPSWAIHSGGFSCCRIWETNASSWGANEVNRRILASGFMHAQSDPIREIGQKEQNSNEYFYIRGGGKFYFHSSRDVEPVLNPEGYSWTYSDPQYSYTLPVLDTEPEDSPITIVDTHSDQTIGGKKKFTDDMTTGKVSIMAVSADTTNPYTRLPLHFNDVIDDGNGDKSAWFGGRMTNRTMGYGVTTAVGQYRDDISNQAGLYIGMGWDGNIDTYFKLTRDGGMVVPYRLEASEGYFSAMLQANNTIFGYAYDKSANIPAFALDKPGGHFAGIGAHETPDMIWFGACLNNNSYPGAWVDDYYQYWNFNGYLQEQGQRVYSPNNPPDYVRDYSNPSNNIRIGATGAPVSQDAFSGFAVYTPYDGHWAIKDMTLDTVKGLLSAKGTLTTGGIANGETISGDNTYMMSITVWATEAKQYGYLEIYARKGDSQKMTLVAGTTGENGYWGASQLCVSAIIPAGYDAIAYGGNIGSISYSKVLFNI